MWQTSDFDESENFRRRRSDRWSSFLQRVERRVTIRSLTVGLTRFVPISGWFPEYDWRTSFFADLSAGLTMAVFSVPTGIAHANICGVDPVYGLYTSIFPTFLYMIFGNSKYNALGPFAILSVLTQSLIEKVQQMNADSRFYNTTKYVNETLAPFNSSFIPSDAFLNLTDLELLNGSTDGIRAVTVEEADGEFQFLRPIHVATTIMFLSGIFHIILGICRADFLSCYLSEQVMSGFVVGGYVHVFFSQVGETLGIRLPVRSGPGSLFYRVRDLFEHLHEFQPSTLIVSAASIVFLMLSRCLMEPWLSSVFVIPIPYELLLVIVGITATNYADLSNRHAVSVVGNIPTDFPPPALPRFELIPSIFVTTFGITIVTVAIHLTVVKIVENRYHHRINSCQELYALGFVSVLSSAFPVFPVTSIFARTLVGNADKNTTQLTTFFSSVALLAVVLYIGPALEYLPKCILASIILVSLTACFDRVFELRKLWPLFKTDLVIFIVTFLLIVCYDLAKGLIAAVVFAVLTTVVRNQCSSWHILIHDSEVNEFREVPKQQLNEIESHAACIFRFDGALIFTSVQKFAVGVRKAVKRWEKREVNTIRTDDAGCRWRIRPQTRRRRLSDSELDKPGGHLRPTILIIDCSGFPYIDYLGLCTLKRVNDSIKFVETKKLQVYNDFDAMGVIVKFAAPKGALLRMFENTDFYLDVPRECVYRTVRAAVAENSKPLPLNLTFPLDLNQQIAKPIDTIVDTNHEENGGDRLIENDRKSPLGSDEFVSD